jgi:hypothetical protein
MALFPKDAFRVKLDPLQVLHGRAEDGPAGAESLSARRPQKSR